MIIWSRWGIVVLPIAVVGVGLSWALGAGVGAIHPNGTANAVFTSMGFVFGAVLLAVFNRFVVGVHIDKPRQAMLHEDLPEPVPDEYGRLRTHRVTPAVHPETGQPVMMSPTSSLFFVPLRFWPWILGGFGVVTTVISLAAVLAR
jgi:hypothetical protein